MSISANSVEKPSLNFWQIWNMCFGFLGIQMGFALQNANVPRIFQTMGAEMNAIPILFIAAPLTGLIVQPIIGHFSDKTWNRMGRRRPYFFWGALITTASLVFMPHSPTLWMAAGMLWILDASINVTMEPFRAFVGDMLPSKQRTFGYVMQTFFIGIGAVIASSLPYIFTEYMGVANTAPEGQIPDSVRYAFYVGAVAVALAVGWTIFRTKEYSPEQLASFIEPEVAAETAAAQSEQLQSAVFKSARAIVWLIAGTVFSGLIFAGDWDYQLYIISVGLVIFGLIQLYAASMEASGRDNGFVEACRNVVLMPKTMRQLAVVQFFSWFPLFTMWIYTVPAITSHHYGSSDTQSAAYNEGANWVGVLFSTYNGVSILAALLIPIVVRKIGLKGTHQFNLILGAIGFASILFIQDPKWMVLSFVGVGFAWASILSVPYAILADSVPTKKMGIYMGVFNFFIVIPQLVAASLLGLLLKYVFDGQAIYTLGLAAFLWFVAAVSMWFVRYEDK